MLDAFVLVVGGVQGAVVGEESVEGMVGEPHPAVVVESLEDGDAKDDGGDTGRHAGDEAGQGQTEGIAEQRIDGVHVLRPVGEGDR